MSAWAKRGAYALQLAGDRADLWPAGALAALAYLGWLPLLLVVAQPDGGDLSFMGVSLVSSGAFPANVVALSVALVAGFVLLCLLAGLAETGLLRMAAARDAAQPPFGRATLAALVAILVAALPAVGALGAVLVGLAAAAPGAFTSPDLDTSVLVRLAGAVWPFLVLLVLAAIVGQALGGAALRRSLAAPDRPLAESLSTAAGDALRRPGVLALAAAAAAKDVAVLASSYALLRVLWAPIEQRLADGRLGSPETLLLLLGFVAIWLGLLLAAGALHVAVSAWWALELARTGRPAPRPIEARRDR